jgi:hypothetical protein
VTEITIIFHAAEERSEVLPVFGLNFYTSIFGGLLYGRILTTFFEGSMKTEGLEIFKLHLASHLHDILEFN